MPSTRARLRSAKDMRRPRLSESPCAHGVQAYLHISHGRLLVRCPWCMSAEYAHLDDRRFFCTKCLNGPVQGAPVEVVWPDDFDRIEDLLTRRSDPGSRNWEPGESADMLESENAAHDVH